ncbi:hypothetical protein COOONC_15120 [Cooperia oncophora]
MSTEEAPKTSEKSHDNLKEEKNLDNEPAEAVIRPAAEGVISPAEQNENQLSNGEPAPEKLSSTPPSSSAVENSTPATTQEAAEKIAAAHPPTIVCEDPAPGSVPSTSKSSKSPAVKDRSPTPTPTPVPPARTKKRKCIQIRT